MRPFRRESRLVSLCWFLPPQISKRHERTRAGDLLGHLIGHEGKGSITAYLKKRQLISYLMAGFDDGDSTSAGALMKVVVELTKELVRRAVAEQGQQVHGGGGGCESIHIGMLRGAVAEFKQAHAGKQAVTRADLRALLPPAVSGE